MAEDRIVAGIRCSEVLGKLSGFVDGELPPAEVSQIREHVSGCDWCERFGGEFAAAVQALRDHDEDDDVPGGARAKILAAIK